MTSVVLSSGPHDLEALGEDLEERYFGERLGVAYAWGKRVKPMIRLGWFEWETRTVFVAGRLNSRKVPKYVVGHIVYHELCHAVCGVPDSGRLHDERFCALEARYRWHARALHWLAFRYQGVEI